MAEGDLGARDSRTGSSERDFIERDFIRRNWHPQKINQKQLEADTQVRRLDTGYEQQNPFQEQEIGHYRPSHSAKVVTADKDILDEWAEAHRQPPSFLEAGPREKLRFNPCTVRAAIVVVGGTAPSTNALIHAIVDRHAQYAQRYAQKEGQPDNHAVVGIKYGFEGLGTHGPTTPEPEPLSVEKTTAWRDMGGCELGQSRVDFHSRETRLVAAQRLVNDLQANILYVVGGDGGMRAAAELSADPFPEVPGWDRVVVVGIPKTMDNDIAWVWQSLGFRTALAEAARMLNVLRVDAEANRRIILVELFGADAGFVTAQAALASDKADCVLIPEVPTDPRKVVDYAFGRVGDGKRCALVVVAEGTLLNMADRLTEGKEMQLPQGDRQDPYWRRDARYAALAWLRNEMKNSLGIGSVVQVVVNQPGYLVRAVPGCAEDQTYARRLGDLAADSALAGYTRFMISQVLTEYVLVPLDLVRRLRKRVPPRGIFWREVVASTGQPELG